MTIEEILQKDPYSFDKGEKKKILISHLNRLDGHHSKNCEPYRNIIHALNSVNNKYSEYDQFPSLPVRLFKVLELKSITDKSTIKTLTSSGTTSQQVSKIYLDKDTSKYQTKALSQIMKNFIGNKRNPMIIIDSENVIKDRKLFSARGAGIMGMSNFGRDHFYALDSEMNLKVDELIKYLENHQNEPILLFGFTFMIWKHFVEELEKSKLKIDLSNGILIHSGGWKKLADKAVDGEFFKAKLNDLIGLNKIHNFYGMVEQIGSVYMECEYGFFHSPVYSEIIIRNPNDWSVLDFGREGVIELLSILPHSYPGHVLLTEDLGVILGEDDCQCGRHGRYFKVSGRIPKAEIRGCSDTYEDTETGNEV